MTTLSSHSIGKQQSRGGQVARTVVILSLAFCLANISSVMVFTALPLFFDEVLKVSLSSIANLEATVEMVSLFMRSIIGSLSDRFRKRKLFILIGYGLYAVSRALLVFVSSITGAGWVRTLDKLGNGVQASSREALISDVSTSNNVGSSYGLNRALGMVGSMVGTALVGFLIFKRSPYPYIFKMACIPAFLALISMFWVKEPELQEEKEKENDKPASKKISVFSSLRHFPKGYWKILGVISLFKMGYFSGVFLILLFKKTPFDTMPTFMESFFSNNPAMAGPFVMIIQNYFCSFLSFPLGKLSDRLDKRLVIGFGFLAMLGTLFLLGFTSHWIWFAIAISLYGVQMAIQGSIFACISDAMPQRLRGTGFGLFYIASGIAAYIANKFIGITAGYFDLRFPFKWLMVPIALGLLMLFWVRREDLVAED